MVKRRNRRALRGFVTKKKAAKKSAKKAAKKAAKKTVKKKAKASSGVKLEKLKTRARQAVIARTIPDLVAGKFVAVNTSAETPAFLGAHDEFKICALDAVLFPSQADAQRQIDDVKMLAAETALIHQTQAIHAGAYLETSYAFDPIPDEKGELGLHASVAKKGDGKPFKDALKTIRGIIKDSLSETKEAAALAVKVAERFKEQWG